MNKVSLLNMTQKVFLRFMSIFLILLLGCSTFGGLSLPGKADSEQLEFEYKTKYLPKFSFYIPDENINNIGHTSRLPEYDLLLDSVGYLNADGTSTAYVFAADIKYYDNKGVIREKDVTIVSTKTDGYAYAQAANNIQSYFKKDSSQAGLYLTSDNFYLKMTPITDEIIPEIPAYVSNLRTRNDTECYIQYDEVFGKGTHLRYTTGLTGVKEDIILDWYTGQTQFKFEIDAGDLVPRFVGNGIVFSDAQGEDILTIPSVIIKDSAPPEDEKSERFAWINEMLLDKQDDGTYILTVCANNGFLTNPNTVYPVYIDPTVQCATSADSAVYSNYAGTNFGTDTTNMVGYSSSLGTGYFYAKFNLGNISSVRYDNILSAFYRVREISGLSTYAAVDAYMVNNNWAENTITWNNKPGWLSQRLSTCVMKYNDSAFSPDGKGWYDFYITSAVMGWKQGLANNGIVLQLRSNPGGGYRALCSKEYAGNVPLMYVTYVSDSEVTSGLGVEATTYYIKNKQTKKYLTHSGLSNGSVVKQADFTGANTQKWTLAAYDSTYYYVYPYGSTTYTLDLHVGAPGPTGDTDVTKVQLWTKTVGASYDLWKFTRNWNGTYRIQPKLTITNGNTRSLTINNSISNAFIYTYYPDYDFTQDWTLEPVSLGDADFYSQGNSVGTATLGYARTAGFNPYDFYDPSTYNAATIYNYMPGNSFVYTDSHGWAGGIAIESTPNTGFCAQVIGSAKPNEWYVSQYSANQLKKLQCVVYDACSPGATDINNHVNLVGMTYKRGAHFSMGWTIMIWGSNYREDFVKALSEGKTIYDAMIYAESRSNYFHGMWNRHYLGDLDIVFRH